MLPKCHCNTTLEEKKDIKSKIQIYQCPKCKCFYSFVLTRMYIACENCAFVEEKTKEIIGKIYSRFCSQSKEYMTIEDAQVLHGCKQFVPHPKRLEKTKSLLARLKNKQDELLLITIKAREDDIRLAKTNRIVKEQLRKQLLTKEIQNEIGAKRKELKQKERKLQKQLEQIVHREKLIKKKEAQYKVEDEKRRIEKLNKKNRQKAADKRKREIKKQEKGKLAAWRKKMRER